ncbi:MAG: hypothetical protein L0215_05170 [Gemmataceae bacterium]|nr:hypothetical protein [Gemmataceae bacterium]
MALPFFAVTLFVSAFLLFLVQPMIGKMILPKLGGTPQVWNTCMLFFQTTLLAGYAYTHSVSTKLSLRRQLVVHCGLLIVPLLLLLPNGPFNITGWSPPAGSNPIWSTLILLAIVVGVPFFVVSTSAPLLQKWFASTGHPAATDPYFLYGASNLGSLLSLVAYPFVVEPWIPLQTQAWVWAISFVILAGLILGCAVMVFKAAPAMVPLAGVPQEVPPPSETAEAPAQPASASVKAGPAPSVQRTGITRKKGVRILQKKPISEPSPGVDITQPRSDEVTNWRRLRWVLLAFAPSSLMLGATSFISVDLSPFPLLWVIPLALYLLSFILVYSKWPTVWLGAPHSFVLFAAPLGLCALSFILMRGGFDPFKATLVTFAGFFLVALMCHGEIARDRPATKNLTEYFLFMSVGGALGGVFNALLAPQLFVGVAEYPIAIVVACFMKPSSRNDGWLDELLMSAFPQLGPVVRAKGDQVAQGFGLPAPRTNWILNWTLDILLALFVVGLALWLKNTAIHSWFWFSNVEYPKNGMVKLLKFIGFSPNGAKEFAPNAAALVVYGLPLLFCFFYAVRPSRFGLAMMGLLLANLAFAERESGYVFSARTYFGVLRVYHEEERDGISDSDIDSKGMRFTNPRKLPEYTFLMHGTTYHGRNYYDPPELRRLATTYYHRKGPVGVIMERYNWFPGKQNTYHADARLPASMVGLGALPLGVGNLPLDQLTCVWSEPPYATIGLGTGTMASYGRCFQHVVYYEIDDMIRNFSLPPNERFLFQDRPFFNYLADAVGRGSNLEVVMGDARLSMAQENPKVSKLYSRPADKSTFFLDHSIEDHPAFSNREKYYKVIVVDAFSSDAIPLHLLTKEAVELYFSKLAEDGVLCLHTSNRHMDLVKPATDIAKALKKAYIVGHDVGPREPWLGHFGSEYVMLANHEKYLIGEARSDELFAPDEALPRPREGGFNLMTRKRVGDIGSEAVRDAKRRGVPIQEWHITPAPRMRLWTDDFSNIVSILR